ncbi:MAG: hypothetical protein KKC20_01070 [Proteobacteria bacterium]|nr:hypothetical protein [Pseudomonadota bacterium]
MPDGYSYEIRENAQELYVVEGKTYDHVAKLTEVSIAQLKRWGKDADWAGARKEYREALSSIRRDTVMLRAKLLKTALGSGDPQSVYAFAAIEKAVSAGKKSADPVPVSSPEKLKDINTPQDAIEALQGVVELKLNKMLAQPETLQLSQVKELKQTMELIDQMKAKYSPDEAKGNTGEAGLSDSLEKMIRKHL